MKSLVSCLILCCVLYCTAWQNLPARTVNVSTYAQLKSACQSAEPGDTILIAPGVYTISDASRIMVSNHPGPVLVRGTGTTPYSVVVEGLGQDNENVQMVFNLDNCPQWTFENLMTRNSYYHGFKFDKASTDCVLRNVVMRDHGESGVKGTSDPAAGVYPDRLLVEHCDIGFTTSIGGTRSVVEGIDGVGVKDWVIRSSRFVNVQKGGSSAYAIFTKGNSMNTIIEACRFENCFIAASFGGGGTGIPFFRDGDSKYEHRNGIIRNNVMIHCSDAGVYINKGLNCKVYNNTLIECELTIQLRFAETSGYVRNNLVVRSPHNPNEPIIRIRDGASILANEQNLAATKSDFVTVLAGNDSTMDFHLAEGSAAIDAGVNVQEDVPTDIDGDPRPQRNLFDAGADERSLPNTVAFQPETSEFSVLSCRASCSTSSLLLRFVTTREQECRFYVTDLLGKVLYSTTWQRCQAGEQILLLPVESIANTPLFVLAQVGNTMLMQKVELQP